LSEPVDFALDAVLGAAAALEPASFAPESFEAVSLDAPESRDEPASLEPESFEPESLDTRSFAPDESEELDALAAEPEARESVLYHPLPLNTMPTGWMILRSVPPHCSHVVNGGSV